MKNSSQKKLSVLFRKSVLLFFSALVLIFSDSFFSMASDVNKPVLIKVGAYANPPKIIMDENGRISGFWPDLIQYMADAENWKIKYVPGTWEDGLLRLKNKAIDIMPDVAFTDERDKLYTFSKDPVLMSWSRVYVNSENKAIQSILDLKNKTIAALKGSVNLEGPGGLREIAKKFNLNAIFLELNNYTEVFRAVEEKKVDAGITNRNFGDANAEKFQVRMTPIIFQPINVKFAFPENGRLTPFLVGKINARMEKLKLNDQSIYYHLLKKYFESPIAQKPVKKIPQWIWSVLAGFCLIFVFCLIIIAVFKIQVNKKTREIRDKNEILKKNKQFIESLVNLSNVIMYIYDIIEQKNIFTNDGIQKILGYSVGEIREMGNGLLENLMHPDDFKIYLDRICPKYRKAKDNEFIVHQYRMKHKNGQWHWLDCSELIYLRRKNGSPQQVFGVVHDITEQKKAEIKLAEYGKELEKKVEERTRELQDAQNSLLNVLEDVNKTNQKLESANIRLKELDRLKSMFIASMSHELRTPLNSIIGFTGIILQGMAGEINDEIKDQLERVYRAGRHLLSLINDVIDISKIEAGRLEIYAEKFNINDVIKEAVSVLDTDIKDKNLVLEIESPADLMLTTDRKRLLQCLINYVSNAVKYTAKGKIKIYVREIQGKIEITVSDTGIGIKKEDIPTLFDPFIRIESHLKTKVPGTGLGLYLTKKIITEMLEGEIFVNSIYGKGSTFGMRVAKQI